MEQQIENIVEEHYHHLDNNWIQDFEKTDKLYHEFYTDDNYYINTFFIYLNKKHEIEKIREEIFIMKTPNIISREEIIGLVQKNSLEKKQKYSFLNLLKFNISLEPEHMKEFLQNTENKVSDFFIPLQNIDTIKFDKTIHMFQDLNTLYFIYLEKTINTDTTNTKKNVTKKIYAYLKNSTNLDSLKNVAKKHKKTIRKL
jgi:hypothetical protein